MDGISPRFVLPPLFDLPTDVPLKRKREPRGYREQLSPTSPTKRRRKEIADYRRCSTQQRHMYYLLTPRSQTSQPDARYRFETNSLVSPLLRLPAEIRNEIYGHVFGNNVIHISVRECPRDDEYSWSHASYYRNNRFWMNKLHCGSDAFLTLTHTICTLPFDEEDRAYQIKTHPHLYVDLLTLICLGHLHAKTRQHLSSSHPEEPSNNTSYSTRHKSCYQSLARLKGNWTRDGLDVSISPFFKPAPTPGLAVHFLQTCRQIYTEARDLIYTSNTFAFHEGHTLDLFVSKCLSSPQRKLITSVQLDGWMSEDYDPGKAVKHGTLRRFTGLRSLLVAVQSPHLGCFRLHTHYPRKVGAQLQQILGQETAEGVGRRDVVRVTVDRSPGRTGATDDPAELEGLVRASVEAEMGFIV